jgi:hypothetical protein
MVEEMFEKFDYIQFLPGRDADMRRDERRAREVVGDPS